MLTASQKDTSDVVSNFISMLVITQMGEMYYTSISSILKDELELISYNLPIINIHKTYVIDSLKIIDKALIQLTYAINFAYECIYFYMFPMLIYVYIVINPTVAGSPNPISTGGKHIFYESYPKYNCL